VYSLTRHAYPQPRQDAGTRRRRFALRTLTHCHAMDISQWSVGRCQLKLCECDGVTQYSGVYGGDDGMEGVGVRKSGRGRRMSVV